MLGHSLVIEKVMSSILFWSKKFLYGESSIPARAFFCVCVVFMRMEEGIDADADPMQPESEAAEAHYVWQYFTVENHTEAKKGGSKNALCMFCDKVFSGCSTARAAAHLLGRPVMGQHKAGIQACVAINKKDDDRRGSLRQARKTVGEAVRVKEHSLAGIKRKQQVLDELATPSPKQKSVESSLTGSQTTGSKEVDAAIASLAMQTSSRCLLGIMKMFEPSRRERAIMPRITADSAGAHVLKRVIIGLAGGQAGVGGAHWS